MEELPARSNLDAPWLGLTEHQKVTLLKSHTRDFGMTKEELRPLLFTRPITEIEVSAVFATLVTEKSNGYPAIAVYNGPRDARIDKYNGDGTVTVTDLKLYMPNPEADDDDIYGSPSIGGVVITEQQETMDSYVPYDRFDNVGLMTEYYVMLKRCKEFKYPNLIAKKRFVHAYMDLHTVKALTKDAKAELLFRLYVEALSIGCDLRVVGKLIRPNPLSISELLDVYKPTLAVDYIEQALRSCMSKKILAQIGIDVYSSDLEGKYTGYALVAEDDMETLQEWLKSTFKAKRAPYFEKVDGTIRLCGGNTIDLRKYNMEGALDQINTLIYPCGWEIVTKESDIPNTIYLKLKRV